MVNEMPTPVSMPVVRSPHAEGASPVTGALWGALVLLTLLLPWGMYGDRALWSWSLFNIQQPAAIRAMLIAAWSAGLVVLVVSLLVRGTWLGVAYLLAGGAAVTLYARATHLSPLPWMAFVPIATQYAWLQVLAVASLVLFLTVTGVRGRAEAGILIRVLQCLATAALAAFVGMAVCQHVGDVMAIGRLSLPAAWLNLATGLTAGVLAAWGCLLAFRGSLRRNANGNEMTRAGRRLVLASLLLLFVRGLAAPVVETQRFSAALGSLSNEILLAGISLVTLEGLIGVLTRVARPTAPESEGAEEATGVRFAGAWALSTRFWSVFPAVVTLAMGGSLAASVLLQHVSVASVAAASGPDASTAAGPGRAGDWCQWCGRPDRNMVSDQKGLPERFEVVTRERTSGLANVKWAAKLGGSTMGSPVVAGGRVYVGGTVSMPGVTESVGVLWCFQESDGRLLWRMRSPSIPLLYGRDSFGICSTPTVEGDRVYLVGHLGDVLCLDANGRTGGIENPFVDEARYFASGREVTRSEIGPDGRRFVECSPGTPAALGPLDARVLWKFDLLREVRCWPYNALSAGIVVRGERLYVATCTTLSGYSDGSRVPIEEWKKRYKQQAYFSPSLIALDKNSGKLLAWDTEGIFEHTFHGAHSSPALGTVHGKELLFYGGGNGTCYAFDPEFAPGVDGGPGELKRVWKFDCLDPASYDSALGVERLTKAETIATPVFYRNRVYTSVGNDLARSGPSAKQGRLVCIDATKTGDITATGRVWSFDNMRSTSCTVAIADGLLYTADASGMVYCLDAETGSLYWTHQTAPVWGSPLVADGKVFVGTHQRGVLIFAHSREKKVLFESGGHEDFVASPAVAHGVLYLASQRYLYALEAGRTGGVVEHGE
jgi:outer membrane protein assembly factor BamB